MRARVRSSDRHGTAKRGVAGHALTLGAATLVGRLSGYFRTVTLAAVIGVGSLANAFGTANAFPNMMFELLMGGGLRTVLVPTLVNEFERDRNAAWRTVSAVTNITVVALSAFVLLAVAGAPWIFRLLTFGMDAPNTDRFRQTGTVLLVLMIPQVIFYGLDLIATGVLNAHRRFVFPAMAVVAGNAVAILAILLFGAAARGTSLSLSGAEFALLGGGMTAGVATIALAELATLRRLGARYSLTLGRGVDAVRRALKEGGWMFLYVLSNQLGLLVVLVLANRVRGGVAAYQYAYTFFMLPYGVAGLALASTLLPEASSLAARGDRAGVSRVTSEAMGLALLALIPASVVLAVWGRPIAQLLLGYGAARGAGANFVGEVLSMFSLGLVPFTMFQLLARALYAFHKTRSPALVNAAGVAVNIIADLFLFAMLEGRDRIVGLAAGHAASYLVACAILWLVASRMLGTPVRPQVRLRSIFRPQVGP